MEMIRRRYGVDVSEMHVGPLVMAGAVAAGATVMGLALARRSWPLAGAGAALAAGGLLWRPMSRRMLPGSRNAVRPAGVNVEHAVTINRRVEDVYRFWRSLENLPFFMRHLESVKVLDERHSRWQTRGPAGTHVEWTAQIIEETPNRSLAWRSLEGSDVAQTGTVRFRPVRDGQATEVRVRLTYNPPAGRAGDMLARVLGSNARRDIADDLQRFKELMEVGEVQPTGAVPLAQY